MADHQAYIPFDNLFINSPPYPNHLVRSYHSSDESDAGSHGGGGFRPTGQMSGREFIAHRHPTPSFSAHGRLLVDEAPYFPPREQPQHQVPQQFVAPASLHLPNAQYGAPDHYRQHVEEQWAGPSGSPPPYYSESFPYPGSHMPTAMAPSVFQHTSRFPDAGDYLRQQLNLPPNAPVNLWSVPEPVGGEKPSIPLPMLIKLAIYGSEKKRLTLQEIYTELTLRFKWFREHNQDQAWKNSIRHNLSLNKVFRSIQRPVTEPGKGSYWELDISGGEGYKRPRKRLANSKSGAAKEDDASDDSYSETEPGDEYRASIKGRRRSPYAQDKFRQSPLRANTDPNPYASSSPPTTGSGRGNSLPMIDPPAPQRGPMPSGYRQPAYGQSYSVVDPALHHSGTAGYASTSQYTGRVLAHSPSAMPVDMKPPRPEGRTLRPRPSLSAHMSSSSTASGEPMSPTDEAYAKSRRRAAGRN